MICQGCWQCLPHLDPQVDITAIQSVGPQTSREEIWDHYYQVYKLRRLPGSVPCGLEQAGELARDIVSSFKNCLRQKEDKPPEAAQTTLPMQSRTPWGQRGGTSAKIQLSKVREVHQKALATTIALEEKIEWLRQSITRGCPDACAPYQSWDQWSRRSQGWRRRCHKALPESSPADFSAHSRP